MQHSNLSTTAPSNTMSENPTKIYDTDIQSQELEKGVYLENILKGNLNRQQKYKHIIVGNNKQRNTGNTYS